MYSRRELLPSSYYMMLWPVLAETIRRGRMDEQHESRYHYNQFAYRMGPEKDMGEVLWNRFRNYNLSLQHKPRLFAGARLMLSVSKSTELQVSSPSASVDEPTVHPEGNSSSEISEESESASDPDDEERSQDTRTGYPHQGNGENIEMQAGMNSQTMPRLRQLTSIKTGGPPEQSFEGYTHVEVIHDHQTGFRSFKGVNSEVVASPTKKRRYNPQHQIKKYGPPRYDQEPAAQSRSVLIFDHPGDMYTLLDRSLHHYPS